MPTGDYSSLLQKFGITNQTVDQTSNFTSLESLVTGRMVDLDGGRWLVTARPTANTYYNGEFVMHTVGIPEREKFRFRAFRMTKTNKYSKWAQDKAHVSPRGVVCVPYLEADTHDALYNTLWCSYSYDGGATFGPRECVYRPETASDPGDISGDNTTMACMSAGVTLDGRQMFFYVTGEAKMKHYMLHRMMPDYRKWDTGAQLNMTHGSANLQIKKANHGYVAGDNVTFKNVMVGAVDMRVTGYNGLTVGTGEYIVTAATANTFTVQVTGTATADAANVNAIVWVSNEWGPTNRVEITDPVYGAYANAHGGTTVSSLNYMHSFCIDENGSIFTTIQGPANGAIPQGVHIVRFDNWRNPNALSSGGTINVFMIPLNFGSGEGTIKYAGSNTFIGFTRGDDFGSGVRARFWKAVFTASSTATITSAILRPTDDLAGRTWDEPTPLIIANGLVYAVRCQRTDDPNKVLSTGRASTKMYLLTAKLTDVLSWADGTHHFNFTEMGRAYWSGAKSGQAGPGIGVGSLVAIAPPPDVPAMPDTNDVTNYARVMYFFGCEQENMTGFDQNWNQGQVYGIHIVDARAPAYAMDNGDTVESGQSDNTQELWYKTAADLQATGGHAGWNPSTGTYATADPTGALANSLDYVGGGVRLERELNGMVTMFGRLNGTSAAANPVMVLPHRFRPAQDKQFLIAGGAAKQNRSGGQVLVLTIFGSNNIPAIAGQVYIDQVAASGLSGVVAKISLDGIRFPTDGDARNW